MFLSCRRAKRLCTWRWDTAGWWWFAYCWATEQTATSRTAREPRPWCSPLRGGTRTSQGCCWRGASVTWLWLTRWDRRYWRYIILTHTSTTGASHHCVMGARIYLEPLKRRYNTSWHLAAIPSNQIPKYRIWSADTNSIFLAKPTSAYLAYFFLFT